MSKLKSNQDGFMECTKCAVWGDIPPTFRESHHFGKCPICNGPMYLLRCISPESAGMREAKKVIVGLMLHGEKL